MTDLEEVFQKAAELVKDLPPLLQPIAFDRAVGELLGGSPQKRSAGRRTTPKSARRKVAANKKTSKKGRRMGGQAALRELAGGSFFSTGRTVKAIIDHLRTNKALSLKSADLTSPLATLTREGVLERAKNNEGVYEYRLPR